MDFYHLLVVFHLLAVFLWFGHMFFWSIIVGPITKRIGPKPTQDAIRNSSLTYGGLGWPALFVLVLTGIFMLPYRGLSLEQLLQGNFTASPYGHVLLFKLPLVGCMVLYQLFIGHRRAPRMVYVNMAAAVLILLLSVLLVRSPGSIQFVWESFALR